MRGRFKRRRPPSTLGQHINDLLDDAAATLQQLGTMTTDDIVRRRLDVCDLAERLASHDAA